MIGQLTSVVSRILFIVAFVLAGLAVLEKVANLAGFTLTIARGYAPSRLLELSVVALVFVITLYLREIRRLLETSSGSNSPG
jgi:hypothetical protein